MKHGLYPKLAWTGISKNRSMYVPYILTCTGMILMFYLISFLSDNTTVGSISGGEKMQMILSLGTGIIGTFSLIFLFYTNSFLMRRRKKEFGLYNILGMGKWNLGRILVWECLIIAGISLAAGLGVGILFSKLSELLMIRILGGESGFSFSISWKSVGNTVFLFGVIFLILLIHGLGQIRLSNPVELLRSENVGEKPPKANWILAILGAVFLFGGYYMAVTIEDPITALMLFFVAVILVIIGTYLLFIAGSVVLCRILQKNKRYYYKTNHFISVSSMVYRMKRNGAGLASICILSTMVLVMISSTVCLYIGTEDSLRSRYPRNIVVDTYSMDEANTSRMQEAIGNVLEEYGEAETNVLHYQYLSFTGFVNGGQILLDPDQISHTLSDVGNFRQIFVVSLADYNQLMGTEKVLNPDEVLVYSTKSDYTEDSVSLEGVGTWKVKEHVSDYVDNGTDSMQITSSVFLFVPDIQMIRETVSSMAALNSKIQYFEHDYNGFDLSCDEERQAEIADIIQADAAGFQAEEGGFPRVIVESVAAQRAGFYALYGGLFFLGVLLGIVFLVGAVLIMYYKQVTEGYEDQKRFEILQKVGMTKREIRKSINSQILTVFFLPLLTAGVHVGFAFPMIYKMLFMFNLTNRPLLIGVTAGCYLIFALFYIVVYRITSRSYYRIVSAG
ncbi:MAG: ABC transporter permease [Lachnospiraceae bacterium]